MGLCMSTECYNAATAKVILVGEIAKRQAVFFKALCERHATEALENNSDAKRM